MVKIDALIIAAFIGVLLILLGGYLFVTTTTGVLNAKKTEATVIETGIGRTQSDTTYYYYPYIKYMYSVDGKKYTNSNYKAGGRNPKSESWARGIVEDYEVGENITINYVPSNPSQSFIKTRIPTYPFFVIGMGILLVIPMKYRDRVVQSDSPDPFSD